VFSDITEKNTTKILYREMTMKKTNTVNRRDALKTIAISGVASLMLLDAKSVEASTTLSVPVSDKKVRIIIVGGGTSGMIATARLRRSVPNAEIILISPNQTHLYQSGQTFVAAGLYRQTDNERKTSEILPDNVKWLQERVVSFEPDNNAIHTDKSGVIPYNFLVIALGVEYDYNRIKGLDSSMIGENGIASVYLNDTITGTALGGNITKS